MKWMRFLAASRSFIGMKDGNSPYRVTERSWLRAVGSLCRGASAREDHAPAGTGAQERKGGAGSGTGAAVARGGRSEDLFPGAAEAEAGGEACDFGLSHGGILDQPGSGASARVVAVERPRPNRSARSRIRGPLVQGELTLDAVKVVRNDLSDADLELVAVDASKARVLALPGLAGPAVGRFTGGWVPAATVSG